MRNKMTIEKKMKIIIKITQIRQYGFELYYMFNAT